MKQDFATVALVQFGVFLAATMSYLVGAAWSDVVQSNFTADSQAEVSNKLTTLVHSPNSHLFALNTTGGNNLLQFATQSQIVSDVAKQRNRGKIRYAILITVVGVLIMVLWTLLIQSYDPAIVNSVDPSASG